MEFLKAFTYMFKGKKWYIPMIIGIIIEAPIYIIKYISSQQSMFPYDNTIYYLTILSVFGLITLFNNIFISGYYYVNANSHILKPDSPIIQWSEFSKIVLVGLKTLGAAIIYSIPFGLILLASFIAYIPAVYGSGNPANQTYYLTLSKILPIIILLLMTVITPAFTTNLKFKSFFNFKLIFKLIKNNPKGFLILLGYTIIVPLITFLLYKVFISINYLALVFMPIISFYLVVVRSKIVAIYVRGAAIKSNQ